ncbi:zeta toxin family protein, partial [Anaerobacillus sp. CMMVII]|uniref:zeta toxin family protein n=1 Tax=Anaerobacillus sp. CMMVII TaxID=2755588 RepID=UPI0028E0A32A
MAILVGGGTASGKTSLRKSVIPQLLKRKKIEAIAIDPDEIKEMLPKYHLLKKDNPKQAANLVHKESRAICSKVLMKLIKHRKHFIYEETMARSKKYVKFIENLRKATMKFMYM